MERQYRRVRVLIYEGPYDWVMMSSESGNRFVKGRTVVQWKDADLPPVPFGESVLTADIPKVAFKSIEEHLCDIEEVRDGA